MSKEYVDPADIYDNPAAHMTLAGVFRYAGIDLIPMRATIRRGQAWD